MKSEQESSIISLPRNLDGHMNFPPSKPTPKIIVGPLHDPVTWCKIRHAGTQVTQWKKNQPNNQTLKQKKVELDWCEVPRFGDAAV